MTTKGLRQMRGGVPPAAPTLPAMGKSKLERMRSALQMLEDWDMDCIAIIHAKEHLIGPAVQNVFRAIHRDLEVGMVNVREALQGYLAIAPVQPPEKAPPKLKVGKHRRKFMQRPIVPPGYNGILISVKDMMEHRQVSREMIYKDMRTGRLPQTYRWGHKTVWLLPDLEGAMRIPAAWKRKEKMV